MAANEALRALEPEGLRENAQRIAALADRKLTRRSRNRRLLYVAAALPPTRAPEADHALYQSLQFAERGIEVHILTRKGQGLDLPSTITVHELAETWSWLEVMRIVRLLRHLKPNAIMMSFLGSLYDYRTMPTMIPAIAKLLDPGVSVLVQFANIGQGEGLRSQLKRAAFKLAGRFRYGSLMVLPDTIVALSEDHRQKILRLAPSQDTKIRIVPCCPQVLVASDRERSRANGRARLGIGPNDLLVTFFGRLYPGKGIEELIEAVARARRINPNVRLSLIGGLLEPKIFFNVGESYEEELRECVRRHGLEQHVRYSGEFAWDGPEVSDYLHAADLAALPLGPGIHLYNGSLAALCAHGLPVIGTRGAVVDGALRHGENVYFIDGTRPETIENALLKLIDSPGLRSKIGSGAAALASEQFDRKKAASRLSTYMGLNGEEADADPARESVTA